MSGVSASDLRGRKLGLLLSTDPRHENLDTGLAVARAALDRGVEVYLYFIDDGVRSVEDARVQDLGRRGARLFVCAYGRQRRRLPITDQATPSGLVVLTDLLNGTDRFLALN